VDRIALFIDGANLQAAARAIGLDRDFGKLLGGFASRGNLVRATYYTVTVADQEYSSTSPFVDWPEYNGYTVATKAVGEPFDKRACSKIKKAVHVKLAVDATELAKYIDCMVLFSGDGDFRVLVEAMQRRGVHVALVRLPRAGHRWLRRQADVFTDLTELQSRIRRAPHSDGQRAIGD
jgi:uncharacterized LabA/DUF88 family protein